MTAAEAAEILGPELTAEVRARAAAAPPLTEEQIAILVGILGPVRVNPGRLDAA